MYDSPTEIIRYDGKTKMKGWNSIIQFKMVSVLCDPRTMDWRFPGGVTFPLQELWELRVVGTDEQNLTDII